MALSVLFLFACTAQMVFLPAAGSAQEMVSRPVVQSLGSEEVADLGAALRTLARRPRDLAALLEAGRASLAVDDLDAAMGFFGRASEVAPSDPGVKLGLASVWLRSGRPVEALRLYNELVSSDASVDRATFASIIRSRGLAYALVGDGERAHADYAAALAINSEDKETARRLAISHAIAGNGAAFEDALLPVLGQSDPAASRTHAFGLAILGEQARAAAITNEVMPRDIAGRLTPYLAYMPRLTSAQQAAAANLGIFPRAADIGREDPEIAQYRANGGLGDNTVSATRVAAAPQPSVNSADARLAPAGAPLGAGAPEAASTQDEPEVDAIPKRTGPTLVYSNAPSRAAPPTQTETVSAARQQPTSVADAFADLGDAPRASSVGAGAVNLETITVPRERAEPEKPLTPRRFWVQVATGRDIDALRFDWRRIQRKAPDVLGSLTAHVTPWGEANRLLAGPVGSAQAARAMVNDLKAKGLDTFAFTSPAGLEIDPLTAR